LKKQKDNFGPIETKKYLLELLGEDTKLDVDPSSLKSYFS